MQTLEIQRRNLLSVSFFARSRLRPMCECPTMQQSHQQHFTSLVLWHFPFNLMTNRSRGPGFPVEHNLIHTHSASFFTFDCTLVKSTSFWTRLSTCPVGSRPPICKWTRNCQTNLWRGTASFAETKIKECLTGMYTVCAPNCRRTPTWSHQLQPLQHILLFENCLNQRDRQHAMEPQPVRVA